MHEGLQLADGHYEVPAIEPAAGYERTYPEASLFVEKGEIGINSVLFGERMLLRNKIRDPRALRFLEIFIDHNLRLLDIRQLSAPERFETRLGAGRMDRLTTLVDGAMLLGSLEGTFEQHVQNLVSDDNVTIGSHRLGDHIQGDYTNEGAMDDEITAFHKSSNFIGRLQEAGLLDEDMHLAGSPMRLTDLSNPNKPRRYCITEAPRPDGNIDRNPFTLSEGARLLPLDNIVAITNSMLRVEVRGENGQVEERIGMNDLDAARELHRLSMRHAIEHWGDAGHNAVMEVLSVGDKARVIDGKYSPIDELRRDEVSWYNMQLPKELVALYSLVERLAADFREMQMSVQTGAKEYAGTALPSYATAQQVSQLAGPSVRIELGRYDRMGRLIVGAPTHKNRRGIDSWVVMSTGMKRLSELDPSIIEYEKTMFGYKGHYEVAMTLPRDDLGDIRSAVHRVEQVWHCFGEGKAPAPLSRPPMPKEVMAAQLAQARATVLRHSFRAAV